MSHRPLCHKATKIVADALRAQGPLTTQSLYDVVHATHPSSLPARPLPNRYRMGHTRPPASIMEMRRQQREQVDLPREKGDTDGTWSMAYLKKKVLAGMLEKGQVVKMTKIKWDKLRGVEPTTTTTTEERAKATSVKEATKKLQNYEKKAAETHFWILKDTFAKEGIFLPEQREEPSRPTTSRGKANTRRF
ncbi:BQ5605_C003g02357 [Microbotryum silenes-dioicae]|uniref:BQ5605_C003g02357 protein n=1 Tax=Microbotryum silenes-dioicae TaxID=796604 RepID=A0A2X0MNL1_9BASI|nr:BQ5605_C003g02357 [Microbotryum silenes-dioicae]